MQQETSQESWPVFKRLLGYVRDRKLGLVGGIIGMLGYAAVDTTFVYSIKPLIDQGLNGNDSSVLKWMPFFVLGIVALRGCGRLGLLHEPPSPPAFRSIAAPLAPRARGRGQVNPRTGFRAVPRFRGCFPVLEIPRD